MAELKKTSKAGKGRAAHSHIVYLGDNGQGMTSKEKGHAHEARLLPPQPALNDSNPVSPTFGMVIQAATAGGWELAPWTDGHTHTPQGPVPETDSREDEKESKIITDVINLYHQAKSGEESSRKEAKACEDSYCGNQWDKKVKQELELHDRAAHTVNIEEPAIDNLSGYQRQNRTDFRFLPTEEGDQIVADILNILVKNITEQCYYAREETKIFEDQAIIGRGLINIYEDYDKDIFGDIVIEKFKWDNVCFGPHEKEDLADCDYLVKYKWYAKNKLRQLYPDEFSRLTPEPPDTDVQTTERSEDWDKRSKETRFSGADADLVDEVKQQYRMLECWRKEYKRRYILAREDEDFVFAADGWGESDIDAIKTIDGFRVIPRVVYQMRVTKIISGVLLEDEYPDLAIQDFHIVPVYAKYRNGEFWGKLKSVKDIQKLINKTYSQFTDILNRMAAYGWFYDNETFPDLKEERKFKENSARPGFTQKLSSTERPPKKEEGIKFPVELSQSIQMFSATAKELMNVKLEMMGSSKEGESGVAIRQKIIQQLLGNDFLFDNMSFAKKKLGRIIIAMVQKMYTPERILRVVANQDRKEKVELGGKKLEEYDPREIAKILKDTDLTKHDVNVSESPYSPSAMMGNFLLLLDMAAKGVPIPPTAFFRFAPIPEKGKIMEELAAAAQQKEQETQLKYKTEIDKSLIAQQGKAGAQPGAGMQ